MLQARIDREFDSLHRDLDSVKDQAQPVQAEKAERAGEVSESGFLCRQTSE